MIRVLHGDCIELMATMPDNSIDAIVTDPPYGLEFMGKGWDGADGFRRSLNPADAGRDNAFGRASRTSPEYRAGHLFQEWCELWTAECLRVLKPGGHLLAFGAARTSHRLACAVEDAGFQMRDPIAWLYGSGFPKSKTILKPAFEPIIVGRKALDGTEKANVAKYGTGALNIEACRTPTTDADKAAINAKHAGMDVDTYERRPGASLNLSVKPIALKAAEAHEGGRWPANVVLDESQAQALDQQSGTQKSGIAVQRNGGGRQIGNTVYSGSHNDEKVPDVGYGDSGGASRFFFVAESDSSGVMPGEPAEVPHAFADLAAGTFFYCAKAPTKERPSYAREDETTMFAGSIRKRCTLCGKQEVNVGTSACTCPAPEFQPDKSMQNKVSHPTVKPLTLMRWLVRLVTPPGGTILDPFGGSGTTGEAALLEGFNAVLIEREADYLPLIEARLAKHHTPNQAPTDTPEPDLFDLIEGPAA